MAVDNQIMIDYYNQMHKENPNLFPGMSIRHHVDAIAKIVSDFNCKSILDYGCGQGKQYTDWKVHERWNLSFNDVCLYDPGVEVYSKRPIGKFDGVICTDVLEHVEEEYINHTLQEIFNYAEKFVYLVIATFPAGEFLPDGRNAHVSLFDEAWWFAKINQANVNKIPTFCLIRHDIEVYSGGWI